MPDTWLRRIETATDRTPLVASQYATSGTLLERVVLADGRTVIAKWMSPEIDIWMRALSDDGRIHRLWTSGLLAKLPVSVDHATLGVEPFDRGWLHVMRDVSAAMMPMTRPASRDEWRRIVAGACAMHEEFRGQRIDRLCPLADHLDSFTHMDAHPSLAPSEVGRNYARGWELFADVVPDDVAQRVYALRRDPSSLLDALGNCEPTLVHGDFRKANLGLDADRLVVIDWGTFTTNAAPWLDVANFLARATIDGTRDEQIEVVRSVYGSWFDEREFGLALIFAFLECAPGHCLSFERATSDALRARARTNLDWWIARVRVELDRWGG